MKDKRFTFLAAAAAIFICFNVSAQDATSVPVDASPTPRAESSATPSSRPSATPSAPPKPARAKDAPTPAKERKAAEEKPASKKTSVDNSSDGKNGAGVVRRLEGQWQKAIKDHDAEFVNKIISGDFVGVSSNGKIGDKATILFDSKRDKNTYRSVDAHNLSVHSFGPHVVVAIGLMTETGKTWSDLPFTYSYRFSDTWVERDGKWQCVAAHSAAVPRR